MKHRSIKVTHFYEKHIKIFSNFILTYHQIARMFKDYLMEHNFPLSYFSNVGPMVRHDHIMNDHPDLYSDKIFIFVDNDTAFPLETETVPAGTYMSMCCSEFEEEKTYALQLFKDLQKNNYEILGDYLCEVVTEYPNIENGQREIFYKMQIRIR